MTPVDDRLLLIAQDADELPLISTLVQDATVRTADIAWNPRGRRLVLLVNRYRWERDDSTRVRAALRFDHIDRVARRGWPGEATVLDLLALTLEDRFVTVDFAGGPSLRLDAECVDVALEDLSAPWTTQLRPHHAVD
jgi:hypothetical protein